MSDIPKKILFAIVTTVVIATIIGPIFGGIYLMLNHKFWWGLGMLMAWLFGYVFMSAIKDL